MTSDDQRKKFALIAYGLGLFDAAPGSARSSLFRRLCEGGAAPHDFEPFRGGVVEAWLTGERTIQKRNRERMKAALAQIAAADGRTFNPAWWDYEEPALARALGVDRAAFDVAYQRWLSGGRGPSLKLDFVIPDDRAERFRKRYHGVFFAYRIESSRPLMARDVVAIGPEIQTGVSACLIIEPRNRVFRGFVTPTAHSLVAYVHHGSGGDGFNVETMVVERHSLAENLFAGVRTGLSDRGRLPTAVKTVLLRQPTISLRADSPDEALDAFFGLAETFSADDPRYACLYQWLRLHPSTDATAMGLADFGANAMCINGAILNERFGDFSDPPESATTDDSERKSA